MRFEDPWHNFCVVSIFYRKASAAPWHYVRAADRIALCLQKYSSLEPGLFCMCFRCYMNCHGWLWNHKPRQQRVQDLQARNWRRIDFLHFTWKVLLDGWRFSKWFGRGRNVVRASCLLGEMECSDEKYLFSTAKENLERSNQRFY